LPAVRRAQMSGAELLFALAADKQVPLYFFCDMLPE
jgi:hypothetical protein